MIIYFSDQQTQDIQVRKTSPSQLPSDYLIEREKIWSEKTSQARTHHSSLWNGEIYDGRFVFGILGSGTILSMNSFLPVDFLSILKKLASSIRLVNFQT